MPASLRGRRSSHTIHLVALSTFQATAHVLPDLPTLVVGGGAFVLMFAMAATSNDAAVRWLGARRWKRLHRLGIHWLWFVFAFSYGGRLADGQVRFAPLFALAIGALGLRVAAARTRHRKTAAGREAGPSAPNLVRAGEPASAPPPPEGAQSPGSPR